MDLSIATKEQPHFKDLKQEVYAYLASRGVAIKRPGAMIAKSVLLWSLWCALYTAFLVFGQLGWGYALGLTVAWTTVMLVIQLSVMHDASHGAASDNYWLNQILTGSIAFLGGSALLWKNQHCQAHHSFTNVHNYDHDIDTHGLLRLHPAQEMKWYHRYQYIYAWLIYPLFTLNWIWWGDFRDIINNTYSISAKRMKQVIVEVVLIKMWHVFLFLWVPAVIFGSFWTALICYLVAFSILGFCMVVIFQLAHVTNIQDLPNQRQNHEDWVWRQVSTTANFSMENYWLTWCLGGLNYQVEHHLFPTMCHLNYPMVWPIVKNYCLKYNLPYFSQGSLWQSVLGHQRHLIRLGTENTSPGI